jgi:hypothetical protein
VMHGSRTGAVRGLGAEGERVGFLGGHIIKRRTSR